MAVNLRKTDRLGAWGSNWTNASNPNEIEALKNFRWPVTITNTPKLQQYSGLLSEKINANVVHDTVVKTLLPEWEQYLMAHATNIDDYKRLLGQFQTWANQIFQVWSSSNADKYQNGVLVPLNETNSNYLRLTRVAAQNLESKLLQKADEIYRLHQEALARERAYEANSLADRQTALDAMLNNAISIYQGMLDQLLFMLQTTEYSAVLKNKEAAKQIHATHLLEWSKYKVYLDVTRLNQLQPLVEKVDRAITQVLSTIEHKTETEAKQTNVTYQSIAITPPMIGLDWSSDEQARLAVTTSQINNAVSTLDGIVNQLRGVLMFTDKQLIIKERDKLLNQGRLFIATTSLGVKDSARWKDSINQYNKVLSMISDKINESENKAGLGLVIAIAGAVAGGAILLS
jgi:hypothetical protein